MTEYILRFIAGGAIVSAFAILGDMLKPKSFSGLLGQPVKRVAGGNVLKRAGLGKPARLRHRAVKL